MDLTNQQDICVAALRASHLLNELAEHPERAQEILPRVREDLRRCEIAWASHRLGTHDNDLRSRKIAPKL